MDEDEILGLKVEPLKEQIRGRGLVPKCKKKELRGMLRDCMVQGCPVVDGPVENLGS